MLLNELLLRRHKREIPQTFLLRVRLNNLREADVNIRGDVSDSHERECDDTLRMQVDNSGNGKRAPIRKWKDIEQDKLKV